MTRLRSYERGYGGPASRVARDGQERKRER
jgi:hypothetical protein